MQIKNVMTREVVTIEPDATLQQAAEKMASLDVGMLPVCEGRMPILNHDKKLVGIVALVDLADGFEDKSLMIKALKRLSEPIRNAVHV